MRLCVKRLEGFSTSRKVYSVALAATKRSLVSGPDPCTPTTVKTRNTALGIPSTKH